MTIASQRVEIKQEGDPLQVATITRGLSEEEGGYHWSGELRPWDNKILMGWYAAACGASLTRETSATPAGLTSRARPKARAEARAANLTYRNGGATARP